MLHRFFENLVADVLIKNIISSTSLPNYRIVRSGDRCVKDLIYIYNNYVCRCIKSGIVEGEPEFRTLSSISIGGLLETNKAAFEVVRVINEDFTFWLGDHVLNLTKDNICNTSNYDPETHRLLGEYLRAYRDKYDINLMPLYNCFNYKLVDDIYIDATGNIVPDRNKKYKVILIPAKFNKTYTIAIDSGETRIKPLLYGWTGLVKDNYFASGSLTEKFSYAFKGLRYPYLSFNKPVTYKIDTSGNLDQEVELVKYEKWLYLAILVSAGNESSLVVLEGDYTNTKTHRYFNSEAYLDRTTLDEYLLNPPALLRMNDKLMYSYDDVLVLYLVHNVITHMDLVRLNVLRVLQQYNKKPDAFMRFLDKMSKDNILTYGLVDLNTVKENDIWNLSLRQKLYDSYTTRKYDINLILGTDKGTGSKKLDAISYQVEYETNDEDINGFVDNSMEKYLYTLSKEVYINAPT